MSTFGPSSGTAPSGPPIVPPTSPPWPPPATPPVPAREPLPPRRPRRVGLAAAVTVVAAVAIATGAVLAGSDGAPSVADHRVPAAPAITTPAPLTTAAPEGQTSGSGTEAVVSAVDPAIVDINTTVADGEAAGTGMVLTADGYVLTNNHVIEGATSTRVQIQGTGPSYSAHVVGYDVTADVAVIKLDDVSDLDTIPVGDSSSLQVGDTVVAIGNALGEPGPHAVSTGSVRALDETVTADGDTPGASETLHGMIQHDAGLQPGDSGGALVDSSGKVVGMNTVALASRGRRATVTTESTEGYAIPMDEALTIARQIMEGRSSATVHIGDRAILGVQIGQQFDGSEGVVVAQVDDGPAADAGVQAGDAITGIDGTAITSLDDLTAALGPYQPGDEVELTWTTPEGSTHSATVALAAGPPA